MRHLEGNESNTTTSTMQIQKHKLPKFPSVMIFYALILPFQLLLLQPPMYIESNMPALQNTRPQHSTILLQVQRTDYLNVFGHFWKKYRLYLQHASVGLLSSKLVGVKHFVPGGVVHIQTPRATLLFSASFS